MAEVKDGDDPDQVRAETGMSYELITEKQVEDERKLPPWNESSWHMLGFLFNDCMFDAHELCQRKGWWYGSQDHVAIKVERVHAELSELCDTFARGTNGEPDKDCPDFTKAEIEWADCMLRLMDLGARYGFRAEAIRAKFLFNRTRPLRHGGKSF